MSKSARERARALLGYAEEGRAVEVGMNLLRDLLAEADAYRADCLALRAQDKADAEMHGTEAMLQAQLTAARAEAEAWRAKFEAVLQEARCWAGEAKSQRATVNEVGSVLGGVPDWGPIATKVASLRARLERADRLADAAEPFRARSDAHSHQLALALRAYLGDA